MGKFKRKELVQDSIPDFQFSQEAKEAPLGAVATVMLLQAPKKAQLYGERVDGKHVIVVREKTWVETYG